MLRALTADIRILLQVIETAPHPVHQTLAAETARAVGSFSGSGISVIPVEHGIENGERRHGQRVALVRDGLRRRDDAGASEASVKQTPGGMGVMGAIR